LLQSVAAWKEVRVRFFQHSAKKLALNPVEVKDFGTDFLEIVAATSPSAIIDG